MMTLRSHLYSAGKALLMLSTSVPAMMLAQPAAAQEITSSVRGQVIGPAGAPVANAEITVRDTRTGRTRTVTTNAQGRFDVPGLEVGGPYEVLVESARFGDQRLEGISLSLGSAANLNIELTESQALEEIVVTGRGGGLIETALGPSASFGLDTLENLPSIQRDIRDTIRIDPRISIDDTNSDSIRCLGGNNRFNSFTIDGVRNNDAFGLNASGFPSRNTLPIPFDSIRQTTVEFSPFDVEFGQFTGCNINVVTKSGSNEFHGSTFFVFNSDELTGDTIEGEQVLDADFRDWNWGAELSGPIIKDKLFLYFAYEETSDSDNQDSGPIGGGFANGQFLTVESANEIQEILRNKFNRDPMGFARNLPQESRRFLIRGDWFITDDHRAAFTFSSIDEENTEPDDFGFNGLGFQDNFEIEGSDVESWSLRVFSDWTDNLSTEFRISRIDTRDKQNPVGGGEAQSDNPKTRIIVQDGEGDDIAVSGPGFFRSANELDTQVDQIKAKAEYRTGRHTFTAGYELDQLDVFNLFIQNATGTLEFPTVEALNAGEASFGFIFGCFSGDPTDCAAEFSRSIHSVFLQDEIQATPELLLTFGLRYDFFESSDQPPLNEQFLARYGFANTKAFDDLDIFMPRFGFQYDAPWEFYGRTTFRGGAGVFAGSDPTVWFSNAFSNFGSAIGVGFSFLPPCTAEDLNVLDSSGSFTGFPDCITQQAAQSALQNDGPVDAVDPDFELPSIVRGSFGLTHYTDFNGAAGGFFDEWEINLDVIHTRRRDAPDFVDITLTPIGRAPDGRPIFNRVDPLLPGCDAIFLGPRQGFSGNVEEGGPCDLGGDDTQDILLTNVDGDDNGGSLTLSTQFYKQFQYDLWGRPGTLDFNLGYAFTDATEVNPTTSSTSGSNTEEVALSVVNQAPKGPSQFTNRHNLTMSAIFRNDWWNDNTTTFGFFFQAREGRPFSFTFGDDTTQDLFGDTDDEARQLLYVPTGPNDPLVDFSQLSQQEVDAFFAFINDVGLDKFAGEIAPRNAFRDPWFTDLDLRIEQEFPGPLGNGDKFEVTIDFDNLLNLIDSGANLFEQFDRGDVGEGVPLVSAELSDDGSQFVFTSAEPASIDRFVDASLWRIQVGVRYQF